MNEVNTVLGAISPDDLGFTLMHEHVMVSASGLYRTYPDLLGADRDETAIAALKRAKAGGIDTIVDATTFDLGRDPEFLARVSRGSGVKWAWRKRRSIRSSSTTRGVSSVAVETRCSRIA